MNFDNMKFSGVYPHKFNNAEQASQQLMEDLSTKVNNGHFIRVSPNIFLYISDGTDNTENNDEDTSQCCMVAASPLHYFYSNLETIPDEDENTEIKGDNDSATSEDTDSNDNDSSNDDSGEQDDLTTPVLLDDSNTSTVDNTASADSNIDLAHNAISDLAGDSLDSNTNINDNTDDNNIIRKSITVILPLSNPNLVDASKDVEGQISNKYNGQIFRHNDVMFTHIRPDGTIDRVCTGDNGHTCTSFK